MPKLLAVSINVISASPEPSFSGKKLTKNNFSN